MPSRTARSFGGPALTEELSVSTCATVAKHLTDKAVRDGIRVDLIQLRQFTSSATSVSARDHRLLKGRAEGSGCGL
jgi:hypothetical protein